MIVVADSSALIALSICDGLFLLEKLFDEIKIPGKVYDEITVNDKPEARKLAEAFKNKIIKTDFDEFIIKGINISDGELHAIALYKKLNADFLLIDDKLARKIAKLNKIRVIGSLGVLLTAKEKGIITNVKPFIEKMQNSNLRISDELYNCILEIADEK